MPIEKQSLNNFLPNGFETLNQEGYKENFNEEKIKTGYEKDVPDIVSGPNLNNLIDVIGKNTNTLNSYIEYLNSLKIDESPIIDVNNKLNSTKIGLRIYSATETYSLNNLVSTVEDGKVKIYRSLIANNLGHVLTNEQYWEEVKLGDGSGLEVCDIGMALYVDETKGLRRYLNGQIVDINTNTQAFLNRLKQITTLHPSLLCTEEEWQTAKTMSVFEQVGKFVFNYSGDEIISVRIPAIVNVQGLFDLQNLGMTVGQALPSHTHTRGTMEITGQICASDDNTKDGVLQGAFYLSGKNGGTQNGGSAWEPNIKFKASRAWTGSTSAPNYSGTVATGAVRQEAIQYPYFIQIATGSETENNIVNDIELNNPYSLFDSKYSDHELNNLSWLKSEGQWNAKAVYPTAYDKLLKVYNGTETVEGLSVKLSTEEYTDYDFVLNTADETFRLPLLDGSEDLSSFNYKTLTLQNNTGINNYNFDVDRNSFIVLRTSNMTANTGSMIRLQTNSGDIDYCTSSSAGTNTAGVSVFARRGDSVNVGTFGTWGTLDIFRQYYATGNGSLYYYVGETVQNVNLIDAGRIGEQVASLIPDNSSLISGYGMPSSKYIDLTLGDRNSTYTAPTNGTFVVGKRAGAVGEYINIQLFDANGKEICPFWSDSGASAIKRVCGHRIEVQKGQRIMIDYNLTGVNIVFRFFYAEGSK